MKRKIAFASALFAALLIFLVILTLSAEKAAGQVRHGVLRFHVVANSDSVVDQQNKYLVRDGIANICADLFESSESKAQSMHLAEQNKDIITYEAEKILKNAGCDMPVKIDVTKRFFPTRHYEGVSLPAGVYDTIDVKIGRAEGKNFWCVMFPSICIGASSQNNKESMEKVLQGDALELVTEKTPKVKFKFRLIELFENFKKIF